MARNGRIGLRSKLQPRKKRGLSMGTQRLRQELLLLTLFSWMWQQNSKDTMNIPRLLRNRILVDLDAQEYPSIPNTSVCKMFSCSHLLLRERKKNDDEAFHIWQACLRIHYITVFYLSTWAETEKLRRKRFFLRSFDIFLGSFQRKSFWKIGIIQISSHTGV